MSSPPRAKHDGARHPSVPRSTFVLDTRELERRPGRMRRYHVDAIAPGDLGTAVLGVPDGSPVSIDLRLESVTEGIVATGTVTAPVAGGGVRGLDPIGYGATVEFQELYVYPESEAEDDEAFRLDGDDLDLEPAVRDALVLALPFQPVCRPDCPGLCVECGARLADEPGHSHDDRIDPRWAALLRVEDEAEPTDR